MALVQRTDAGMTSDQPDPLFLSRLLESLKLRRLAPNRYRDSGAFALAAHTTFEFPDPRTVPFFGGVI